MEEKHVCCICHKKFVGYGNNPYPYVGEHKNDCCCDQCNIDYVIPRRISEYVKA